MGFWTFIAILSGGGVFVTALVNHWAVLEALGLVALWIGLGYFADKYQNPGPRR